MASKASITVKFDPGVSDDTKDAVNAIVGELNSTGLVPQQAGASVIGCP